MAKWSKPKRTPRKRGPKEEVLRIEDDPQDTLRKLVATRKRQAAAANADFNAAHDDGIDSLKRRDYDGLGDAIRRERKAIEDFRKATQPIGKPIPKKPQ